MHVKWNEVWFEKTFHRVCMWLSIILFLFSPESIILLLKGSKGWECKCHGIYRKGTCFILIGIFSFLKNLKKLMVPVNWTQYSTTDVFHGKQLTKAFHSRLSIVYLRWPLEKKPHTTAASIWGTKGSLEIDLAQGSWAECSSETPTTPMTLCSAM